MANRTGHEKAVMAAIQPGVLLELDTKTTLYSGRVVPAILLVKGLTLRAGLSARLATSDSSRVIRGTAAHYNVLSRDLGGTREIYAPGCFTESIASDDVRTLYNHDTSMVLGRVKSGTLTLFDRIDSLDFEIDLPETSFGTDLAISMERGDVDGAATGFFIRERHFEIINREKVMVIDKARLLFVSISTFPTFQGAGASIDPSPVEAQHENAWRKLDEAKQRIQ